MAVTYRIKDWDRLYENSDTKRVKSFSKYVPVPNRMDGSGYAQLLNHPNGPAHYGAWISLIIVASKCETRGVLAHKNGEGLDLETLSLMTRVPVPVFEELLPRLLSKKIDWIEAVDQQGNYVEHPSTPDSIRMHPDASGHARVYPGTPGCTQLEEKRVEESREEEKRKEENPPNPPRGSGWEDLVPDSLKVCQETIGEWIAYKAERGKKYKPRGLKGLMTQLAEWGPQRTEAAIRHSIACNYDGVYEPRAGPGKQQGDFYGGLLDFVEEGAGHGSG